MSSNTTLYEARSLGAALSMSAIKLSRRWSATFVSTTALMKPTTGLLNGGSDFTYVTTALFGSCSLASSIR
jgi:hypothetical protein